jgi:hypothetical protein
MRLRWASVLLLVIVMECTLSSGGFVRAASTADFNSATNAIGTAFVATHDADQSGGNVSQLVTKLSLALSLVQKAQSENSTNSAMATSDLQNATRTAQQVSAEAPMVAKGGAGARALQVDESIGASVIIILLAAVAYLFGDRVYRRLWLYAYRDFLVRTPNA